VSQFSGPLCIIWSAILLVAAGGCAAPPKPQPVNLSAPQLAAVEYVKALQRGDSATARVICSGSEQELRWIDSLASLIDGIRQLNNALYDRFGRYTHQIHTDLEESLRILADEPVELISNGSIRVNATEALIQPTKAGFTAKDQMAIVLRKQSDREIWKVDLARTFVPPAPRDQLMLMSDDQRKNYGKDQRAKISAAMEKYQETADVFHHIARDVRANRFKSIADVEAALGKEMAKLQR